jgi:hypothetical protein
VVALTGLVEIHASSAPFSSKAFIYLLDTALFTLYMQTNEACSQVAIFCDNAKIHKSIAIEHYRQKRDDGDF